MALALRLTRLPVCIYQETVFQHSCLGNAFRSRNYVTSSDQATKKSTTPASSSPIPPKNADFSPPTPKEAEDKVKSATSFKNSDRSKTTMSEGITKLQQLQEKKQDAVTKVKMSTQQVRDNVRGYMFTRFFDYVKNYDTVLEKNFPSAVKVYRVFFDGVKEFFADMKRFLKVSRIVNSKGVRSLNRQELELYIQMPRDMIKVAPALIFSSLPMVGYAIFPLVFMFPRSFLSSHFWTLQQKSEFKQFYFHERLTYNKPVFRCLQTKLKSIKEHPKHEEFRNILGQLGSGTHPTVEQLLDIKDIFAEAPFSLISLSGKHIKLLNKLHGINKIWFKRFSLYEHAYLVHYMDKAICREGGVHNMPLKSLRNACYIRGLNPVNLSNEEMIEWLRDWIHISKSIQAEHLTLFLHLPIFLGYNHPNNWQLLYGKDKKQPKPQTDSSNE